MTQSEQLFEKSEHFLPGGVNSPVRAFRNVGGTPVFVKSGKGSHILDEDGNCLLYTSPSPRDCS